MTSTQIYALDKNRFSRENTQTFQKTRFTLVNELRAVHTTTNNNRLGRIPKSGIRDYFGTSFLELGASAHLSFTSGPIGGRENFLKFFRGEKFFSKNMFWENFENFWKISKFYKDFSTKSIFEILTLLKILIEFCDFPKKSKIPNLFPKIIF